jgi:putative hydrolase of the HAD superfamily
MIQKDKIKVVSLDFWDTICSYSDDLLFVEKRIDFLAQFLDSTKYPKTKVAMAIHSIFDFFENLWHTENRTPTTPEMLKFALSKIGASLTEEQFAKTVDYFENLITNEGAEPCEDAVSVIKELSKKYKLVLISDTGFEPGIAIRKLMKKLGILDLFVYQVFSDETGFSKPDLRAFQLAAQKAGAEYDEMIHIGDRENKDIIGAKQAGMQTILFTGLRDNDLLHSKADEKINNWLKIQEKLL